MAKRKLAQTTLRIGKVEWAITIDDSLRIWGPDEDKSLSDYIVVDDAKHQVTIHMECNVGQFGKVVLYLMDQAGAQA